jgi:hypothetical protein
MRRKEVGKAAQRATLTDQNERHGSGQGLLFAALTTGLCSCTCVYKYVEKLSE